VTNDAPSEFPEQRFTKELIRISAGLQSSDQADRSLVDLFEVLINYGRETDCDLRMLNDQFQWHSELADGSLDNHRRSILMAMLQDTLTRLRCRVLNLEERLEVHAATRQANASYGGVAHWEHVPQSPHVFRYQS
jgi:hypothetical protein